MFRKSLIFIVLCILLALSSSLWLFWSGFLSFLNSLLQLTPAELELWEKRRNLIWPIVTALGVFVLGVWKLLAVMWKKAGNNDKANASQRNAEQTYLKNLLREYDLSDVEETYINQEGGIQREEHLPERFFEDALRYDKKKTSDDPHKSTTPSKHYTNVLAAFAEHKYLVMLGDPGMGKTYSLSRIAAEYARQAQKDACKPIPVVIPLNEWLEPNEELNEFIKKQIQSQSSKLLTYFETIQEGGRLVLLFDALNEIPVDQRSGKLEQVKQWIKRKEDYSGLLLTCREQDYTLDLKQDLDRLTIEPLKPPRIQRFLRNYFRHYFNHGENAQTTADELFWQLAGGEEMQEIWRRWQQRKPRWKDRLKNLFNNDYTRPSWDNFWEKENPEGWYWQSGYYWDGDRLKTLNNSRSLMKLAENPFLLTMIASIYNRQKQLPESRRELFEEFVSVLLGREQEGKNRDKLAIPPENELKEKLKELAWKLQSQGGGMDDARTTMLRKEAEKILSPGWIKYCHAATILEIVDDKVRFTHQLLQEFFTAQRFKTERESGLLASEIWESEKWWEPNGWEVATRMALEYETDEVAFVQWLAEGNPKLAAEIALDQGLSEALVGYQSQWKAMIVDSDDHPNPHERHAVSTALAWLGLDDRFGIGLDEQALPQIDWVEILEGEFIYQKDEKVALETYWMSRYPVTNAQFKAFVEAKDGYNNQQWWDGLYKEEKFPKHRWIESNRPVESVNWHDAMAFCRWLSAKVGVEICLPTEQQWEKAARGFDGREYPWEGAYQSGKANIDETWDDDQVGSYKLQETSATGIYPQGESPYKLADMSGNVWEWCLNKYAEPDVISVDVSEDFRVVRGGSWYYDTEGCRSAYRDFRLPHDRYDGLGFRLCCVCSPLNTDSLSTESLKKPLSLEGEGLG